MASPTTTQVHIDTALTNVAIRYSNAAYIAERVFPAVPVAKQSDKYFVFAKADWFRDDAGPRAPGTRAPRIDYSLSTGNYLCVETAAAKQVPDEVVRNADAPLRPFIDATNFVTEKLLISQEREVLGNVFGTSWSSSATPSPTWDDDTSKPLEDIETGINTVEQAIGRMVNRAVVSRGVWRYLKNHPDIVDRIKGGATQGDPALVLVRAFAALIEIDDVLVSRAVYNSARDGATASISYIAGSHMWLGYVTPTPSIDSPTAGYVFQWKTRQINRYIEDQEHAQVVEALANWDTKITATDAGYLLKSAVS